MRCKVILLSAFSLCFSSSLLAIDYTLSDLRVYAQEVLKDPNAASDKRFSSAQAATLPASLRNSAPDYQAWYLKQAQRYFELGSDEMNDIPPLAYKQKKIGVEGFEIEIPEGCFPKLESSSTTLKKAVKDIYLEKLYWQINDSAYFLAWYAANTLGTSPHFYGVRRIEICDGSVAHADTFDRKKYPSSFDFDIPNVEEEFWTNNKVHTSRENSSFPSEQYYESLEKLVDEHDIRLAADFAFVTEEKTIKIGLNYWNAPMEEIKSFYNRGTFVDILKVTPESLAKVSKLLAIIAGSDARPNEKLWKLINPTGRMNKLILRKAHSYKNTLRNDPEIRALSDEKLAKLEEILGSTASNENTSRLFSQIFLSRWLQPQKAAMMDINIQIGRPFSVGNSTGIGYTKSDKVIGVGNSFGIQGNGVNVSNNHDIQVDFSFMHSTSAEQDFPEFQEALLKSLSNEKMDSFFRFNFQVGSVNTSTVDKIDVSVFFASDTMNFDRYKEAILKRLEKTATPTRE